MPGSLKVEHRALDAGVGVRVPAGQLMIKIRNYKKTDYSQVASILKEANLFDELWDSKDNLSGMVDKNPESIIVAEDNNNFVVGNLFIVPYGTKIAYLFRLAVRKNYRKQGIASALIQHAQTIAKRKDFSEVGFYVDSHDQELQAFYKKREFQISKKSYFYMWRELK